MFLSLVCPPLFLYISLSIEFDAYIFQSHFPYLSLIHAYPPVSIFISFPSTTITFCLFFLSRFTYISFNPLLLISAYLSYIDLHLFLSFCQSKFTATTFKPVFFISLYFLYIYLYLFLSLVYPPLFLYISLSIHIGACLFQLHFIYFSLIHAYPPVSIFISFPSTTITFYLFLYLNSHISLSIPLS